MKFKDDWWEDGLNYFDDLFNKFGFIEVEEKGYEIRSGMKYYSNGFNKDSMYFGVTGGYSDYEPSMKILGNKTEIKATE